MASAPPFIVIGKAEVTPLKSAMPPVMVSVEKPRVAGMASVPEAIVRLPA